tara:strand:+ start:3932 stop:4264 length:333 start_codon:yes stop_codon:yes gene_type:complete
VGDVTPEDLDRLRQSVQATVLEGLASIDTGSREELRLLRDEVHGMGKRFAALEAVEGHKERTAVEYATKTAVEALAGRVDANQRQILIWTGGMGAAAFAFPFVLKAFGVL